jgi:hypothetical protein
MSPGIEELFQFATAGDVEFPEDVLVVSIDGLEGNVQQIGDSLVALTLAGEPCDLFLPRSQGPKRVRYLM